MFVWKIKNSAVELCICVACGLYKFCTVAPFGSGLYFIKEPEKLKSLMILSVLLATLYSIVPDILEEQMQRECGNFLQCSQEKVSEE